MVESRKIPITRVAYDIRVPDLEAFRMYRGRRRGQRKAEIINRYLPTPVPDWGVKWARGKWSDKDEAYAATEYALESSSTYLLREGE